MSRAARFLSLAALMLFAANRVMPLLGAEPAPAALPDPIEWNEPKQAPTFREVLKEADYKNQFDKAASQIDIPSLEKSKSPVSGQRILRINPGSQAVQLGLHAGEIVTMLDGQQVWIGMLRRDDAGQTLTVVDKHGEARDVQIQPGLIGLYTHFEWRPELAYLRSKQRDPRWDKSVLVGITTRATNPDLAETALHHAVEAGLSPGRLIAGVGAEIALEQGRNDAALDFVWSALVQHADDPLLQLDPMILYRVAAANYKLDVAAGILDDYKGAWPAHADVLRSMAKAHRARPEAQRCQPPPSRLAANMRRFNLDRRFKPANEMASQSYREQLIQPTPFTLGAPSGHYIFLMYKPEPAVRDVEAVLKLTLRTTDKDTPEFAKILEVGLIDGVQQNEESSFLDGPSDRAELLLGLSSPELGPTGETIAVHHSGIPGIQFSFEDPLVKFDGTQVIELRMVRVGGAGEIFVNGRRILYAPIDLKNADLGFMFKIVGMTADIKQLQINELLPKTTVHQATDGAVLLKPADVNLHGDAIRYETDADKSCVGYWTNQPDWIDWDVQIDKPGKFEVATTIACEKGSGGSEYELAAGPGNTEKLTGKVKETADWTTFNREKLGTIEIAKPGRITISVKATSKPGGAVMNLRQIELTPAK